MAYGVPSILSANTDHLDIIEDGTCLPLTHQQPISLGSVESSTEGWGEVTSTKSSTPWKRTIKTAIRPARSAQPAQT